MKKKWDELTALLEKEHSITGLVFALSLLTALAVGMIIGLLTCPTRRKIVYWGSCNGNHYDYGQKDGDGAEEALADGACEIPEDPAFSSADEDAEDGKGYVKIR